MNRTECRATPTPGPVPEAPTRRVHRRARPDGASWAYVWSIDLLSRRSALPLAFVLLLAAAVAGAVGLTFAAL